jgi:hypothetical protein
MTLLFASLAAAGLFACHAASPQVEPVVWEKLGPLVRGKTGSALVADGRRLHGKIHHVEEGGIAMTLDGRRRILLPRDSVTQVELKRNRMARKLLVGIGTAAAATAVTAVLIAVHPENDCCNSGSLGDLAAGGAIIAAGTGIYAGIEAARRTEAKSVRVIRVLR